MPLSLPFPLFRPYFSFSSTHGAPSVFSLQRFLHAKLYKVFKTRLWAGPVAAAGNRRDTQFHMQGRAEGDSLPSFQRKTTLQASSILAATPAATRLTALTAIARGVLERAERRFQLVKTDEGNHFVRSLTAIIPAPSSLARSPPFLPASDCAAVPVPNFSFCGAGTEKI